MIIIYLNTSENIATGGEIKVQRNMGSGRKLWQVPGKVSCQAKYGNWQKNMVSDGKRWIFSKICGSDRKM